MVYVDNLDTILRRGAMHGTNHVPNDGLPYRTIHNVSVQNARHSSVIPCGPCGTIHDYVPFYFGPRSPMLYQLHTGWVDGYSEGQEPLIYLVTTAQAVANAGLGWAFSDGHGIARFTQWFDDLTHLDKLDWVAVYSQWWKDSVDDSDRQRKKQAEFLVYQSCSWDLVQEIGVVNSVAQARVEAILSRFPPGAQRPVQIRPEWYY